MFEKQAIVSGVVVRLRPYTERRLKELLDINEEIERYIKDNPSVTFADPELRKKRGEWYKRKADILWESDTPMPVEFFTSQDFEVGVLKESESFFLQNATYL